MQPAADGKGVVVVLKKRAGEYLLIPTFPSSGPYFIIKITDLSTISTTCPLIISVDIYVLQPVSCHY